MCSVAMNDPCPVCCVSQHRAPLSVHPGQEGTSWGIKGPKNLPVESRCGTACTLANSHPEKLQGAGGGEGGGGGGGEGGGGGRGRGGGRGGSAVCVRMQTAAQSPRTPPGRPLFSLETALVHPVQRMLRASTLTGGQRQTLLPTAGRLLSSS